MYSKLFNAIFVHIPKTAGQSVEHVFVEKHNLTWRRRGPLLLRKNRVSGQRPRHLAHLYASEYSGQGYVAADVFVLCFKFATVRNPYDRALSEYKYRSQKRTLSFAEFLDSLTASDVDRHLVPQTNFVTNAGGKLLVDKTMRFESLATDFEQVSSTLFGQPVQLPHINRSPQSMAPDDMNEEVKRTIYKRYECDFDFFHYPRGRDYHHVGATTSFGSAQMDGRPKEYASDD